MDNREENSRNTEQDRVDNPVENTVSTMGGRLFDIWDASEKKNVEISRLPGFGKVKHNDVLVFNFPYPGRWDSLGLNLKTYYVKEKSY